MSIDFVENGSSFPSAAALELVVGRASATAAHRASGALRWLWRSDLTRLVGPLALLALWEVAVTWLGASKLMLSSPTSVASTAWSLIQDGTLPHALITSLRRVAVGLAIGVPVGGLLAVISGISPLGERLIDPVVQMLRTMPALALVPLFILWFGIGEEPKVLLVASAVSFPIYLNLHAGIRGVDDRLVEAGRVLRPRPLGSRPRRDPARGAAVVPRRPALLASLGIAWIVLVASEQINATSGLGFMMLNAQNLLQTDVIFVGLIVYSLLGLTSDLLVRLLERGLLSWRHGFRSL